MRSYRFTHPHTGYPAAATDKTEQYSAKTLILPVQAAGVITAPPEITRRHRPDGYRRSGSAFNAGDADDSP